VLNACDGVLQQPQRVGLEAADDGVTAEVLQELRGRQGLHARLRRIHSLCSFPFALGSFKEHKHIVETGKAYQGARGSFAEVMERGGAPGRRVNGRAAEDTSPSSGMFVPPGGQPISGRVDTHRLLGACDRNDLAYALDLVRSWKFSLSSQGRQGRGTFRMLSFRRQMM
jgi:hypothetical protein